MLPPIVIIALCLFLFSTGHAQGDTVRITPIEFEGALNNPLKGFRSRNIKNHTYDAIVRTYIKWNEIERDSQDGVARIQAVSNQKWNGFAENNTKVIPRVYLDWDSNLGNEYWPQDLQTGDYTSDQFKQRVEELIIKLGKAWDNDSRVAWIQMGIIGYWGEHHHPAPTEWQQELLGDLFSEAFQNKKVLVRRPYETFEDYEFGWYWDSFAHIDQISSQAAPMLENCPDRWKTQPIEGEVAYNWGNYTVQPGSSPDETLRDPSHRDWLINYIRKLHCTGLGWVSEYNNYDPVVRAGAEEVQKAFGYRYILNEITYPRMIQNNQPFSVSFEVLNTGSAPFYYDWPVELRLLDPVSHVVKWRKVFNNVDIREWMPGEQWNQGKRKYDIPPLLIKNRESFTIDTPLPEGRYILALAILDPAGMEPSVKFATQQYFNGGNHPIGYIGIDTSVEHEMLDPSIFDHPSYDQSLHYQVFSSYQSPFGEVNRSIPGIIEAEHYDEGGEGLAFHDDGTKHGNTTFRPEDNVDVENRAEASNGSVVSYTNEAEWLEYTVDALRGRYDITLYYFCGETPGDLLIGLDGMVLDTISGIRNLGWDQPDSVVIENIVIATGGENRILRLEFISGAGFDIDAIKFTRLHTPVQGIALTSCSSDTLHVGVPYQLSATVDPPYSDDLTVHWESSDEAVAEVDADGTVTATKEGFTTIKVSSHDGGFTDECNLFFQIQLVSVYGVTIGDCPRYVLETGNAHQLIGNVAPPDATDNKVTWSSSKPSVASVDTNGLVTGISQGTTTITITTSDGGYKNTCNIGVMSVSSQTDLSSVSGIADVYPNPASDRVFIRFSDPGSVKKVNIYNLYGQLLKSESSNESSMEISTLEFDSEAMIIVRVRSGEEVASFKVVINSS